MLKLTQEQINGKIYLKNLISLKKRDGRKERDFARFYEIQMFIKSFL